ncbi:MAG: phosphoribosyltransferase [Acidobacteria bacterium]|nr:phosphoribosyltransferase [Acidobacteriota bacterium]
MRFANREDAGRQLAAHLTEYANRADVVVLGLPRGGVPVAAEIAGRLHAPLDVLVVRKLGVPGYAELAMGAIASGGVQVLNADVIEQTGISPAAVAHAAARERVELERRERAFRAGRAPMSVSGRVVLLVDDGLATGATMEAGIAGLRQLQPASIVVVVPVGAPESCSRVRRHADRFVCLQQPPFFQAVGEWYEDFSQTTDEEVQRLLEEARTRMQGAAASVASS